MTTTRWAHRARAGALLAASLVVVTIVIALLAYLVLGWQGIASVVIGLVASLVWVVWYGVTGRLRWPPDGEDDSRGTP